MVSDQHKLRVHPQIIPIGVHRKIPAIRYLTTRFQSPSSTPAHIPYRYRSLDGISYMDTLPTYKYPSEGPTSFREKASLLIRVHVEICSFRARVADRP